MDPPAKREYNIGWICALSVEMVAATAMLDEDYGIITGKGRDQNTYHAGRIHEHNVVIAGLPAGIDGIVAAANVAKDMTRTFDHLEFILLVGIGGGVPDLEKNIDIRLGDVVVSQPSGTSGGVVQYDKGKAKHGGAFELKGALNAPPYALLTAITSLQVQHHSNRDRPMLAYLSDIIHRYPMYSFPGEQKDRLFESTYPHPEHQNSCDQCPSIYQVPRQSRKATGPHVHYGVIASGNEVVKDPVLRDKLRASYGALCVEMEAAGLVNSFPFLVVRGICDYADSHKNDEWHPYAAATAAAWTKELLLYVTAEQLGYQQLVQEIAGSIQRKVQPQERPHGQEMNPQNTEYQKCHRAFKLSSYEEQKNVNPFRAPDTCLWVLSNPKYRQWQANKMNDLLWISADPGCGKSVLSKSLIDHELQTATERTCCYFFFKDNENQDNLASAFCALLHQLFTSQPRLLVHALPAWRRNGKNLTQEVDELWRIFLAATADDNSHDVFCILDALDECQDADRPRLIDKLAVFFADVRTSRCRTHSLKVLVTSRPYDSIQLDFQRSMKAASPSVPIIRLRGEDENAGIRTEIDSVIRARVAEMTETVPLSLEASWLLEQKLLKMQNRTYLWLSLAMDGIYESLRDSLHHDENSIKSSIAALPTSVENAYEKILGRVRAHQRDIVRTILHIIVGARRPLNLDEMSIALGIATSKDIDSLKSVVVERFRLEKCIREWCGLFVFIEQSTIYLVHQTAKEFLIYSSQVECGAWKHSLIPADTARVLTQICVDALCLMRVKFLGFDLHKYADVHESGVKSLLEYAEYFWHKHLRDTKPDELVPIPDEDGQLMAGPQIGRFLTASWAEHNPPRSHEYFVVKRTIGFLLEAAAYVRTCRDLYGILLYRAAETGGADIVKKLLDHGADVNWSVRKCYNALEAAIRYGHEHVVEILLEAGAQVNYQGGYFGNALQAAGQCGNEQIVRILLNAGAHVNCQGGRFGNALQAAAERGHERVVKILLDAGARVNHQGGRFGNALQAAARYGHEHIVRILLDAGANINYQGGFFGNALQAAARYGSECVVRILLDAGADVNSKGGRFGNALQAAIEYRHRQVVRILLDAGADVWARGYYENAFEAASKNEMRIELLPCPDGWIEWEKSLDLRSQVVKRHHDERFWLGVSSDLGEVKQIINDLELLDLTWHMGTVASFRSAEQAPRKYIRLGFLRRLNEKRKGTG